MANIIVVGVDSSESAKKAAITAAQLAAGTEATLHVLSAVDKLSVDTITDGTHVRSISSGEAADILASDVAGELRAITPRIVYGTLTGKPADALVEAARTLDARLIVVGNRRVQGIGRVLGSVATDVAHHAPCDVYIVKTV